MGGKKTPDTPNMMEYMQVANQQAQLGKELIQEQTTANRPNQISPYGRSQWTDLGEGRWEQNVTLPEAERLALESQQRVGQGRSELAESMLERAEDEFGQPIEWEAMEANPVGTGEETRNAAEDALYGRSTSRLDPMWEEREEQRYNQLWNQGLRPGDEAWDIAMANQARERTDAYQTAQREAAIFGGQEGERQFGMDFKRRQQAVAEELQRRGASLNEINALTSGQQVQMPSSPAFVPAGSAAPPDLTGAMGSAYNASLNKTNAQNMAQQGKYEGGMQLAQTFGPAAAALFMSDPFSKTDKRFVGYTDEGLPMYSYINAAGKTELGVMAPDVPEAVMLSPEGRRMMDGSKTPIPVSGRSVKDGL